MTINTGCIVEAHPLEAGRIGVTSNDFGYQHIHVAGHVPHTPELWLLKIAEVFGLSGVRFEVSNLAAGIKSSGLGGSATAATAVALLANALSGTPFSGEQIVAIASLIEQDLGVSITGTQEQSNVVFGGVTDYIWYPWGVPGKGGSFGTSVRQTLLGKVDYSELAARIRIYHTGTERDSTDVNTVWRKRLADTVGFETHRTNIRTAYQFREALRTKNWSSVADAIRAYREARTELCAEYMTSKCWDIQSQCERHRAESFPMGAGGGGAVLIYCAMPARLSSLDEILGKVFRNVSFEFRSSGHELRNIPHEQLWSRPDPEQAEALT